MGRPRGEVSVRQILFRAASRRTGLDGFPIIRLSGDYCVGDAAVCRAHAGHSAPFRRSALRIPPDLVVSNHLASFALVVGFPDLLGRS